MNVKTVPELCGLKPIIDEIHVWYASLNKPASGFHGLLSADERDQAGRFHFKKDRDRYIVRHGILRIILGHYLNVAPGLIRFKYGKNSKPALADGPGRGKLYFNLSHSRGMVLYAFTSEREIGVDIEYIRNIPDMEQIVERFFSAREKTVFRALSKSRKREAFFNCWTRKEALIKATGEGLSYPLDGFVVSMVPDEPARLISIDGNTGLAARWSIRDLKPAAGYAAAIAVPGRAGHVHCQEWAGGR
jgi:4'-phosphopantetheinyl transferase